MTKNLSAPEFVGPSWWNTWLFSMLVFLLVFAPLFRGGNRPLPLLIIEIIAIVLVGILLWQPGCLRKLPVSILFVIILALLGTASGLVSVPKSVWVALPGRGLYAEALRLVGDSDNALRAISILPLHTEAAWFRLFTAVSVFLATYYVSVDRILRLVVIVVGIAGFQAALGLMQWGAGGDSILRFGYDHARDAIGTYANRNHLAGFLAMVSPVALGLLAGELGHSRSKGNRKKNHRDFFVSIRGQRSVFLGLIALLILLAIVFTRSRGGIALAMLGLLLSMFAFAWRLGGSNIYGSMGSIATMLLVIAAEIGLLPVLDRFAVDPMQDARFAIYTTTIDGIGHFFPLGSGAGTFPFVYPAFQPIELGRHFVNHVHNDFLEAIFEQGMLAVVTILFALILYASRWRTVWITDTWGTFRFVQVGSGIGVLILLLHSMVDFNLQIPANAIFFAFFTGVFFKYYSETASLIHKRKRRHKDKAKEVELKEIELSDTNKNASAKITWDDLGYAENPFHYDWDN